MAPRTIDNLGVDASTRYALDQQQLDRKILKEAKAVPAQAEVDVTSPSFASEFDLLFDADRRNAPWAKFCPPENYNEQRKRLFTYQIIPSLGSQEKYENQEKKILAKLKEESEKREKDQREKRRSARQSTEMEEEDEEKEKKILIKFLQNLAILDKCLGDISARRMQYQKG
jgi:hypothetical protein